MELVNEIFRQAGAHKSAYDAANLIRLLEDAAFSRVQQQSYGQSFDECLRIDLMEREHESLYLRPSKDAFSSQNECDSTVEHELKENLPAR